MTAAHGKSYSAPPVSAFAGRRFTALNLALALLLCLVMAGGLTVGEADLSFSQILRGLIAAPDDPLAVIVREIRMPRILVGALAGLALGLSGAALQGLMRNPLADPGIIGVSGSAALGAVIAIYFGAYAVFSYTLPLFAMGSALLATVLLALFAARASSMTTLILLGVGLSSLAGALTALAINLAPNPFSLAEMITWLMGSLSNRTFGDLALAGPFVLLGAALLFTSVRGLEALTAGEETAQSLGIDLTRLRWQVIAGASFAVGAAVSVTGVIGFVGLVVPHLVRPFVGHRPSLVLLPSALAGAALLLAADIIVRVLPTSQELKLGVVTALIGAPYFLYFLAMREGRQT